MQTAHLLQTITVRTNNLVKTWNAVYGADGNKYLLYITCSTDCVWNGEENIVTVQPYGEDALQEQCDPFIHCINRAWILY